MRLIVVQEVASSSLVCGPKLYTMKTIATLFAFILTIGLFAQQKEQSWEEKTMSPIERQFVGDVEIIAGTVFTIAGTYLSAQRNFHTQGAEIPCFVFGGTLLLEGIRMQFTVGSKSERAVTRYKRRQLRWKNKTT